MMRIVPVVFLMLMRGHSHILVLFPELSYCLKINIKTSSTTYLRDDNGLLDGHHVKFGEIQSWFSVLAPFVTLPDKGAIQDFIRWLLLIRTMVISDSWFPVSETIWWEHVRASQFFRLDRWQLKVNC